VYPLDLVILSTAVYMDDVLYGGHSKTRQDNNVRIPLYAKVTKSGGAGKIVERIAKRGTMGSMNPSDPT